MHQVVPSMLPRVLLVTIHLLAAGVLLSRPDLLTVLLSIGVVAYALVLLRPVLRPVRGPVLAAQTTAGNGVVKVGV